MKYSSRSMDMFGRSSAFLLVIAAIWLVSAGSVMAQEKGSVAGSNAAVVLQGPPATAGGTDKAVAPIAGSVATVGGVGKTVTASPEGPPATAGGTGKAIANDYKGSLNALSSLYQNEVQRLEKQNGQLKDLYTQGLVARKEIEGSDKAVADARIKLEDIAKQIAAANQPAPLSAANVASNVAASNQAWTTGNGRVDGLIRFYGNQNGVDPYLVYCLMSQESKFKTIATSSKGAQGLMQLMPGTAARYGVTNPYDMAQSIMGGTRYLKDLLKMFNGRVDLALAGYNAGENAVIKHGYAVPPYDETRNYVRLIIARYGKKQVSGAPSL